jgi:molybdate transport system ATP-binding protein
MKLEVRIKKKLGKFLLDVAFESDGVLGLLGASGCGKSMTLKCIAGVEKPDEGRIVLDGRVLFDSEKHIHLSPQERKVGYLFQDYALFPNMTVAQNIQCGTKDKKEVQAYLKRFDLEQVQKLYPAQLSGGQKQRTALARMLAAQPQALLLDEPFSALDNFLKARMEREVMNVTDHFDGPVVFVSHDRNEAYRLTDTIAVMENGRIVDLSEKHELFQAPKTLAATLLTGCKNVTRVERMTDGTYLALDWGIRLQAPKDGNKEYAYAGFRAHYAEVMDAAEDGELNVIECEIYRVIEDTFSFVIQCYPPGLEEKTEYSMLTYETGKAEWKALKEKYQDHLRLRIPEQSVIWMER